MHWSLFHVHNLVVIKMFISFQILVQEMLVASFPAVEGEESANVCLL